MNLFNNALTIIKQPTVIKSYRHILLLSHMRANTSLFGHVLGDHKEINGYYEMHIGYYSWKSLIRQKLLFSENHKIKDGSTYFFDKVLHSDITSLKAFSIEKMLSRYLVSDPPSKQFQVL